jgi:hypothetical protein
MNNAQAYTIVCMDEIMGAILNMELPEIPATQFRGCFYDVIKKNCRHHHQCLNHEDLDKKLLCPFAK